VQTVVTTIEAASNAVPSRESFGSLSEAAFGGSIGVLQGGGTGVLECDLFD